jgi:hypothetical protein
MLEHGWSTKPEFNRTGFLVYAVCRSFRMNLLSTVSSTIGTPNYQVRNILLNHTVQIPKQVDTQDASSIIITLERSTNVSMWLQSTGRRVQTPSMQKALYVKSRYYSGTIVTTSQITSLLYYALNLNKSDGQPEIG